MDKSYAGSPRKFKERFGWVPNDIKSKSVIVHCVSMGEINASVTLIKRLQNDHPDIPITLTTTSTTGAIHAYALYKDSVQHLFLPFDIPFIMRRFFNRLSPRLVLITEVEIWPNMLHLCSKRQVPVCLVNARLSADSLPTYQKLRFLLRPALRQLDVICAQSQQSYDNFKAMGVYKHQLKLTLNMKFDMQPAAEDEEKANKLKAKFQLDDGQIWVAASTHAPEEKFILNVFAKLLLSYPSLRLMMVPRHPHRFEEVYLLTKATGLSVTRLDDDQLSPSKVIIVDQMGWLKACYQLCTVAFIGGSVAPKGGHNGLECAMYAKPMVMGNSTFNNPAIVDMLVAQGAIDIIENEQQCFKKIKRILADPNAATLTGEAGRKVLYDNRGAVELTYQQLKRFLE